MRGVVTDFDEHKGWGTVRTEDGQDLFFHCTQVADGTRTIAVGTEVEFEVGPGRGGRWEAYSLSPPLPQPRARARARAQTS